MKQIPNGSMASNEIKQKTKTQLMSELDSIKGVLDASDDHAHDVDDDDVPILTDDVIFEDGHDDNAEETNGTDASLKAAIRQLESMELPMKQNKPGTLEDKIRHAAAPPAFKEEARARENQLLNSPNKAHTDNRKPVATTTNTKLPAASKAVFESKQPITRTAMIQDNPLNTPVEFTDNQFLKSSTAKANPNLMDSSPNKRTAAPSTTIEEDGSEEILKLLGETKINVLAANHYLDSNPVAETTSTRKATAASASAKSLPGNIAIDALVEEIIDEYKPILEAALRKKLKEKMLDMIKK